MVSFADARAAEAGRFLLLSQQLGEIPHFMNWMEWLGANLLFPSRIVLISQSIKFSQDSFINNTNDDTFLLLFLIQTVLLHCMGELSAFWLDLIN